MQYSADVINDTSDEMHGHLVMSEIPAPDTDYRYVPLELPEEDFQTVEAAAAAARPEVDGTVPLGDSDAVLTAQASTSAVSTASEPPSDTVPSMDGPVQQPPVQPCVVESTSGNSDSAAEVTIPPSKSAVYHNKNFKDPPSVHYKHFWWLFKAIYS